MYKKLFLLTLTITLLSANQSFAQKNAKQNSTVSSSVESSNTTTNTTARTPKPKDFLEIIAAGSGKGSDGTTLMVNKGSGEFKDAAGNPINIDQIVRDSDGNYIQLLNNLSDFGFRLVNSDVISQGENVYRIYLLQKNQ